jgi:putative ABC transport system permease protein
LALPAARYSTPDQVGAFYRRLDERMAALPGVTASGMITLLPLREWGWSSDVAIVGEPPPPPSSENWIETRSVTPGYFRAMGIGLLRGRLIAPSDDARAPQVVVVNQAAVRRFWHGADPLGSQVIVGGDAPVRVVGVVRDVHNGGLDRPALPESYFPYLQQGALNMALVLRTAGDPLTVAPSLRRLLRDEDRELPLDRMTAMTQVVSDSIGPQRFQALLLAIFAALALSLAAIGLYGLLAYSVVQRRQEIGVRLALGATAHEVRTLVLREALRLVLPGALLGLAAAAALRRLLASLLFGVEPLDLPTLAAVALGLCAVALVACLVPAASAAHTDPLTVLREE